MDYTILFIVFQIHKSNCLKIFGYIDHIIFKRLPHKFINQFNYLSIFKKFQKNYVKLLAYVNLYDILVT